MFRLLIVAATAAWLALSPAAQARPIHCSAEGLVGTSRCLIATERVPSERDFNASRTHRSPAVVAAAAPTAMWPAGPAAEVAADGEPAFTAAEEELTNDDPPVGALLLATVGIVGFMLHRRGGR